MLKKEEGIYKEIHYYFHNFLK